MRGFPSLVPRPAVRLKAALAVAAAFANTEVLKEYVPTAGSARIRVRFKATNTGTLLVSPAWGNGANPPAYTVYTTGASAATAVAANTEVNVDLDLYGENFVEVKFTGSATGVITFADVSQL